MENVKANSINSSQSLVKQFESLPDLQENFTNYLILQQTLSRAVHLLVCSPKTGLILLKDTSVAVQFREVDGQSLGRV